MNDKETNDTVVVRPESHLQITDITDEQNPRKIFSSRIFNTINKSQNKQDDNDSVK